MGDYDAFVEDELVVGVVQEGFVHRSTISYTMDTHYGAKPNGRESGTARGDGCGC